MKTLIMAGGKGSRVASIAPDAPKPMIPLSGKPILEYQIDCLRENSLTEIIILTGHLGAVIHDYFGDGSKFGCDISYYHEDEPLGSGGALFRIMDKLDGDFVLINGDVIFDVHFSPIINFHLERQALATLVVHPNSHPHDSGVLVTDKEQRVTKWLTKEEPRLYYKNQVNSGIHILSKKILGMIQPSPAKADLDRDILKPALPSRKIYAYHTPEYIKDMGTPDRYFQAEKDILSGRIRRGNLTRKQKAIFLDRDGTINTYSDFVTRPEELSLIDGAARAVKNVNNSGFLAIVITNQPVIARGRCTLEELDLIHQKMEAELGKEGAYIDDLFFCPHHPDKGFPGERPEYKIPCECRKPKPGMLIEAAEKYNIDFAASWMVGDEKKDVLAGKAVGCKTAYISRNPNDPLPKNFPLPDIVCTSLTGFIEKTFGS
jgi:D-glycero-D-manno-heptose 1,7-bisphosphate phosphatase